MGFWDRLDCSYAQERQSSRLTTRWNGPGIGRQKREKAVMRELENACEGAVPGRSLVPAAHLCWRKVQASEGSSQPLGAIPNLKEPIRPAAAPTLKPRSLEPPSGLPGR